MNAVPLDRILPLNDASPNAEGDFVLYWMVAFRRPYWNFSLQRAVELSVEHGKPLVILEALRCDYRWASDRIHQFVIDGMRDNQEAFSEKPVTYYPYLEEAKGAGNGLLRELKSRAVAVVTDDFPCFFLPRMIRAVAKRSQVAMEAIDSNGIYPMRNTDRVFSRAHYFRRHLQKTILPFLHEFPEVDPLAGVKLPKLKKMPPAITKRWPKAKLKDWKASKLAKLPIDHSVTVSDVLPGGHQAAGERLEAFVETKLADYGERNQPERDVATGLSPYLHFGHISAHEILDDVIRR